MKDLVKKIEDAREKRKIMRSSEISITLDRRELDKLYIAVKGYEATANAISDVIND